ncbi:unnamed protein product [Notodromas monacha]|uniref:Uncharacterized protein n=1 Tax=Notodromas monacha TaxID=399045 RepID=A0A7R9C0Q2_9CRUS|nr:unnamed protein product [Notodromas monacha]CAG0924171.1 unnamed protein product [Notodromas monacha]
MLIYPVGKSGMYSVVITPGKGKRGPPCCRRIMLQIDQVCQSDKVEKRDKVDELVYCECVVRADPSSGCICCFLCENGLVCDSLAWMRAGQKQPNFTAMNKIASRKNLEDNGFIQNVHSLNNNRSNKYKVDEYRSFKQKKSFAQRKLEVANIRAKFPHKVPVIVERYHKEISLPLLDKTKFLVPQELSMSQFVQIIRLDSSGLGCNFVFWDCENAEFCDPSFSGKESGAEFLVVLGKGGGEKGGKVAQNLGRGMYRANTTWGPLHRSSSPAQAGDSVFDIGHFPTWQTAVKFVTYRDVACITTGRKSADVGADVLASQVEPAAGYTEPLSIFIASEVFSDNQTSLRRRSGEQSSRYSKMRIGNEGYCSREGHGGVVLCTRRETAESYQLSVGECFVRALKPQGRRVSRPNCVRRSVSDKYGVVSWRRDQPIREKPPETEAVNDRQRLKIKQGAKVKRTQGG